MFSRLIDYITKKKILEIAEFKLAFWKPKIKKWNECDDFENLIKDIRFLANSAKYTGKTQLLIRNGWNECLDFMQLIVKKSSGKNIDFRTMKPHNNSEQEK